jgi:hypothetical protein
VGGLPKKAVYPEKAVYLEEVVYKVLRSTENGHYLKPNVSRKQQIMQRRHGDMFKSADTADLFCVTTNSTLKRDGSLTMGAGAAKQLQQNGGPRCTPKEAGQRIGNSCGHLGVYGLLEVERQDLKIGLFQTKRDWRDESGLDLIGKSAMQLLKWTARRPKQIVYLNYPGIGCGGREESEVRPIIEELPDTVHVWTRE